MHELERIAQAVQRTLDRGLRGLLVTVIGTRGSTYRRAGARTVIAEDGEITGAISGGCVERDLAERARTWLDGEARVLTYDSSRADDVVYGMGLGCRGEVELLAEPFGPTNPPRLPAPGSVFTIAIEGREPFVETIPPQRSIVIFGSGADSTPVAELVRAIGWRVLVTRDAESALDTCDGVVVMTHNYLLDETILRRLLQMAIPYIGLLGPRTRGDDLMASIGAGPSDRARIHSPIGLDLGAETPEEIALSIVAEMQAVFRGRSARPLSESPEPIHALAPASCP